MHDRHRLPNQLANVVPGLFCLAIRGTRRIRSPRSLVSTTTDLVFLASFLWFSHLSVYGLLPSSLFCVPLILARVSRDSACDAGDLQLQLSHLSFRNGAGLNNNPHQTYSIDPGDDFEATSFILDLFSHSHFHRFLDVTPTSRVIARCTQDLRDVDANIGQTLWAVLDLFFFAGIRLGAIVLLAPPFLLPAVVLLLAGTWIGSLYTKAQLSVKREMYARAPILGQYVYIYE
jgi:hypothetical protein